MTDIAVKTPWRQRINPRMIVFAAVVGAIIGFPAYVYINAEMTGGIENVGNGVKKVDLKAMSLFDFDQVHGRLEDVPSRFRELNGQKVVLYGEVWAPDSMTAQIDHFDLCYSVTKCCFSGPPQVQHFVKSRSTKGLVQNYMGGGLVKVTGTLHVDVKSGPDKIESVYQLDVDSVEGM